MVFGVADGGNGLKEALEAKFTNFQFILDYAHFKQHLYQAVEAMELESQWRSIWLNCSQDLIEGGRVKAIISRLKHWSGQGKEVVFNLVKYLERFRQSVHYQKYRELGLPIGSGEIESSHRYIPQKRLKIPGATWHPNTINPEGKVRQNWTTFSSPGFGIANFSFLAGKTSYLLITKLGLLTIKMLVLPRLSNFVQFHWTPFKHGN